MSTKTTKRDRFAIYTRYSSEMQNEMSLEAQEEHCRHAIAECGGVVVEVFSDGAKSGWSLEREGFNMLRKTAEKGKFDAVIFWKFDRLARSHDHAVMIKMLLRHEYGLKLYCVEGFSEDDDDSPYTAMMEQMLAVFSAFYSKNLCTETKRGKRQRAIKGEFNGSMPPFGYNIVTKVKATDKQNAGLYINPRQAVIVRRAFQMYASGNYSDTTVAEWMNSRHYVQQLRTNDKPVGKEMVRDMLQNRIYTGRVPYADTIYSGSLGQGKNPIANVKNGMEAADLLTNFQHYWQECVNVGDVKTARQQLISKIVDRIFIYNDRVIGNALYGDFGVILGDKTLALIDVLRGISEEIKMGVNYSELAHTQNGSDGHRPPSGCICYVPRNRAYHIVIRDLIGNQA